MGLWDGRLKRDRGSILEETTKPRTRGSGCPGKESSSKNQQTNERSNHKSSALSEVNVTVKSPHHCKNKHTSPAPKKKNAPGQLGRTPYERRFVPTIERPLPTHGRSLDRSEVAPDVPAGPVKQGFRSSETSETVVLAAIHRDTYMYSGAFRNMWMCLDMF